MQPRPLMRSDRVSVPPIRYGWEDDQISFALVTEAEDPSSYKEAIKADYRDKWAITMKQRDGVFGEESNMKFGESTKGL